MKYSEGVPVQFFSISLMYYRMAAEIGLHQGS